MPGPDSPPFPPDRLLGPLFAQGPVVVFVWKNEAGWPVEFVSDSVRELVGVEPAEFTSGRVPYASLCHPEELARVGGEVAAAVDGGERHFRHEDYRLRAADGAYRWVSDWTVIERGEDGTPARFIGYLVDVTRWKRIEEELRDREQQLKLVLESTHLGTWEWDPRRPDGDSNQRWVEMLGFAPGEIPQTVEAWRDRMHPDDVEPWREALRACTEGETPSFRAVHRMRHRDGRWVYLLNQARVVERAADGTAIRMIGTHTDITNEKVAEIGAREAAAAKGLFLASMSHEIRTPLNGILGSLQLLDETALDDEQREYVETVRESGEGLLTIINDVLDLSKIEAGRMVLEPLPFRPRQKLRRVAALFERRATEKGLALNVEIDASVPEHAVADAHRFRQVLANLLSNAVKFTSTGHVTLRARAEAAGDGGAVLHVEVRDTGKGITDVDVIWEQFGQEDASISRRFGGTGLGLAITRQLVGLMGGTIAVASTPGDGAVFSLALPIAHARNEAPAETARRTGREPSLERLRILVVEDNAVNRTIATRVLERLGPSVSTARDGREAVDACLAERFDVVLMDVHMPVMDGLEATRRIRATAAAPAPAIVGLTADAFPENRRHCLEAGMTDFLAKPLRIEELRVLLLELAKRTPVAR